jgi:hypothetical protein
MKLFSLFSCPVCHKWLRCECGYVTVAVIIGAVVAAAGAGYGAYSASQAQAQQNSYAKKAAKIKEESDRMRAEADIAAGKARQGQIEYDAEKKRKSFLSRAAAAGVDISSGSLLETEEEFAKDTSYAKQLAMYQAKTGAWDAEASAQAAKYQSDLFGFAANKASSGAGLNAGVAAGSSLASSYGSYYGKKSSGSTQPDLQV